MIPKSKLLLALRGVRLTNAEGERTEPIELEIHAAERIQVRCDDSGWRDDLTAILTSLRAPDEGALEEVEPVIVQTDLRLKEKLDLNRTLRDYVNSADAPEHVWLRQRRRALWVLIDLLGIAPSDMRRALKMESPATVERYWALRFLVSGAALLIGSDMFRLQDPHIRDALAQRWPDIPGSVIALAEAADLPGAVDTVVHIDAQGHVTIAAAPDEAGAADA